MDGVIIIVEQFLTATGFSDTISAFLSHSLLIALTILLAWLSDRICQKVIVPLLLKITKTTEVKWDDVLFNKKLFISACHIIPAIVIWKLLPIEFSHFPFVKILLERVTAIYITIMSARTVIVFINSFNLLDTRQGQSSAQEYLKSFCGVLKIIMVLVVIIIVIAIALDKSPMTLFAGLGATSAILMLVFKDTIEGFAAGVRLTSNNMLHRGDWITVPGTEINGIVQDITLTIVKVQNFDNVIITITPIALVNGSFKNWIGMQQGAGRRVQRKIYFDFRSIHAIEGENKTNIGQFRKDMEKWLSLRDDVNSDMLIMIREQEATQCGVPLEFYFFLKNKEWKQYELHLAEIMEHFYAVASDYDLKIYEQYPIQ